MIKSGFYTRFFCKKYYNYIRMPKGSTKHKLAFKGATIMTNLTRYTAADLPALMERITRNSIGMDEYFDRIFNLHETTTNYPPYNLVQINNVESHLELALAGFKKGEVNVYTEYGKLFVEDTESDRTFIHKGVASRSFKRAWTLSDDTEVREVSFEDGLLRIVLGKIVPEHHARKDYL
jgi:molecular chaperone IbpA